MCEYKKTHDQKKLSNINTININLNVRGIYNYNRNDTCNREYANIAQLF